MTRAAILQALDGTHPRLGRSIALGIYGVIVLSCLAIALETVPDLPPGIDAALIAMEYAILAIFTVEYLLRMICTPQPLHYAFSFWGIVDFLAIVPALLFAIPDAQSIRAVRLVRLARILKLFHANRALDRIANAFTKTRAELGVFTFIALVVLYLAAVGIYQFEHEAQPEVFTSIPSSLWWAIATLSTVGYGDVYPITLGGRVFTGVVLLVGLGVIAVPAGLITSSLLEEPPADPDANPEEPTPTNKENST